MACALASDKGNWNYTEEIYNKENERTRVLLRVKRGPIFEDKKRPTFEKELHEWVVYDSE